MTLLLTLDETTVTTYEVAGTNVMVVALTEDEEPCKGEADVLRLAVVDGRLVFIFAGEE